LHSLVFINIFLNQNLEIPSKFDFRLGFIDFDKIYFAMNSKYGFLFMVFIKDFYITYSLKFFLNGHILN
jgi:hypothetical protein